MLVHALWEIQERHGHLPEKELEFLAWRAGVPLYRVQELASYFPHFRRGRPADAEVRVQVCRDMTCHLRGASRLLEEAKQLEVDNQGRRVVVEGVSCLGRCDRAPVACLGRLSRRPSDR